MEHPVCTGHDKDHKALGALHDAIVEIPADEVGRVGDKRGEEKQHERPHEYALSMCSAGLQTSLSPIQSESRQKKEIA